MENLATPCYSKSLTWQGEIRYECYPLGAEEDEIKYSVTLGSWHGPFPFGHACGQFNSTKKTCSQTNLNCPFVNRDF